MTALLSLLTYLKLERDFAAALAALDPRPWVRERWALRRDLLAEEIRELEALYAL
jgi:hypothetical protein